MYIYSMYPRGCRLFNGQAASHLEGRHHQLLLSKVVVIVPWAHWTSQVGSRVVMYTHHQRARLYSKYREKYSDLGPQERTTARQVVQGSQ